MARTTQLYILVNGSYREVDLFDDIVIPLTLKVTDIRNFGSKTSGYSLDFDIPNTSNNAILFGLNGEIDAYESTFEVEKDYPAYVTDGSLTTFTGQFRLKKVIKKNNGAYIYYVGYMYGGAKNFVDSLGNETLVGNNNPDDDLDFSEYAITAANFTLQEMQNRLNNRWNGDGKDWGLCVIDKNNHAATPFDAAGRQYWTSNELTPYLHIKEILDKIFEGTGYTYASEFLTNSAYLSQWAGTIGQYNFKNLIYPYTKHNSTLGTLGTPESLYVTQSASGYARFFGYDIFPTNASLYPFLEFDDITTNPQTYSYSKPQVSQYQILNWQPARDGKYNVNISIPFKIALMFAYYYFDQGWQQVKFAQQYATMHDYTYPLEADFHLCTKRNGVEVVLAEQAVTWLNTEGDRLTKFGEEWWGNAVTPIYSCDDWTGTFEVNNAEMLLKHTDILYLKIHCAVPFTENQIPAYYASTSQLGDDTRLSGAPRIYVTPQEISTQVMSFVQVDEFAENQDFDPTAVLNPKTKKLDYFSSIMKMFNLYVEDVSGKTNYSDGTVYPENCLRIEPYEIYYHPQLATGLTNQKDWTDKIDWDAVEYRRVDTLLYNTQKFQYKHDNDYYTAQYNDTYRLPYGDYHIAGEYCTSDASNETNVGFGSFMCGLVNDTTEEMQCPKIFTLKDNGEINTTKEYDDACFFAWRNTTHRSFIIVRSSVTPTSTIMITDYYTLDNLNDGYGADTADLNFGMSSEYLQNLNNYSPTQNNLFNAFYGTQYAEWSGADARIMKASVFLTAVDIATLQLSDLIVINGNTFHILSIDQWKNENEAVECEFIKCAPRYPDVQNTTPADPNPDPYPYTPIINEPAVPIATDTPIDDNGGSGGQNENPNDDVEPTIVDEHKIPLNIVFNDNVAGTYRVVSAEVSEEMYNVLQSGSWNTSRVSRRTGNATITLNRDRQNTTPTLSPAMETYTEPNFYELIASARDSIASKPRKVRTPIEKWNSIPHKKKKTTDDIKAKRGLYSASWQYTYG